MSISQSEDTAEAKWLSLEISAKLIHEVVPTFLKV